MELNDKKIMAEHLRDAMNREDLSTREAARCLNLAPYYLSMSQNENSWAAMGRSPWERIEQWHNTREKLTSFRIPEGEEIWKPKEKSVDPPKKSPVIKEKVAVEKNAEDLPGVIEIKHSQAYSPEIQRLKVALDIEINLTVNGQKVQLR
jgi:hypothetical protein